MLAEPVILRVKLLAGEQGTQELRNVCEMFLGTKESSMCYVCDLARTILPLRHARTSVHERKDLFIGSISIVN